MRSQRSNMLPRDFSYIRRIMMRNASATCDVTLVIHQLDSLITFSVKSCFGEESYPIFFSTIDELLLEASDFFKQFNLNIVSQHERQKEYTLSH